MNRQPLRAEVSEHGLVVVSARGIKGSMSIEQAEQWADALRDAAAKAREVLRQRRERGLR